MSAYTKQAMRDNPGRYKFDHTTGICLSVDDRSLVERFPLYCKHDEDCHPEIRQYFTLDELKKIQCNRGYKCVQKWKAYLQKELGLDK